MTRDALTGILPDVEVALCVGCERNTTVPLPVRWVRSTSGPGATLYGCPACAPRLVHGSTRDKPRRSG